MSKLTHLKEWMSLPDSTKLNVYRETGRKIGLPAVAIEKDWWVVHTLSIIFLMECASSLVFKGGTSLSKGWNLIQRFSEDIDLVLDRAYLGFEGELSKGDIRRLRKTSYGFITTTFVEELKTKFTEAGLVNVNIKNREVENSDQDPLIIEIYYPKLTETDTYLKPGLLVEVGSRSLTEPFTARTFGTLIAENYKEQPFSDSPITLPIVNPERTFLEKIFLLHEEFQRPQEKIRVEHLSRHLYDIEKLMQTSHAQTALNNAQLYNTIVAHRSHVTPIRGVDYGNHSPDKIKFIPPTELLHLWENDYKKMQENMIYGESLSFASLIKKLSELQSEINGIQWV
jgi:Nucleotidyl transferase AbiEii toxin, Type IV TA system